MEWWFHHQTNWMVKWSEVSQNLDGFMTLFPCRQLSAPCRARSAQSSDIDFLRPDTTMGCAVQAAWGSNGLTSTKAMSEQWNQRYDLGIYLQALEEQLLLGLVFGVSGLPLSDIGSRCNKSNETTQQISGRSPFSGKLQKEGVFWGQPILRNRQDCLYDRSNEIHIYVG